MENKPYVDVLEMFTISGRGQREKTMVKNGTSLQPTYDDVENRRLARHYWIQPNTSNSKKFHCKCSIPNVKKIQHFKKHYLMHIIIISAMLTSILFVFFAIQNESKDNSSSKKYPVLNTDLCDPVNPYYLSNWFTPSPTDNFICDGPIQISDIYIQALTLFVGLTNLNCKSKLECMTLIGHYIQDKHFKFDFLIDQNSNVYQGRGWLCPYKSGQLWVGIMQEGFNRNRDSEEMKRILKHFTTEIVSYGEKCGFFSDMKYNYLNSTYM